MNTCSFTFVSLRNNLPCRVLGVERTSDELKKEFNRTGEELTEPSARYFETIGVGPQLFGVVQSSVFYHDDGKWFQYRSAFDLVFSRMELTE